MCHIYVCKKRNRVKNILNFQIFQVEFKNIVMLVRDMFLKNNHLPLYLRPNSRTLYV